ncbi:ABC transporter permease [Streptomyces sp. CBMA156]|uniref:ABC transporter permease n=1 Tax=Streptomyces sp. CBMA156 TaxID=1930280 RepID=UPI001661F43E|nr:ABC transporter permease [Streptomyces sp. CBMA156]MBD0674756.1 ABC transporter [Streptomyces sp. CBMA156]
MTALGAYLADTTVLTGRHLRHLRRSPGRLLLITMTPAVMLIAIGYLFRGSIAIPGVSSYEDYIMAGIAAQVALAGVGPTALGVAIDLRDGLVDRYRSLPISASSVLVGRALSDMVTAVVGLVAVSGLGLLLGWRPHGGPGRILAGFAVLLAFSFVMLWVGILLGTTMRNVEAIDGTGALILVVLSFLSNAYVAVDGLPGWLRPAAEWNPVSSVITVCRVLWGNQPTGPTAAGFPASHPGIVVACSLGIVLLAVVPAALRGFRRAVER